MPPVPTSRGTPTGLMLRDGYQSLITFALNPTVQFWEKTVTPPGWEGGDPIDQTTMHNLLVRTKAARYLPEVTDTTIVVAYDPCVWDNIYTLVNEPTTITVEFPDNSQLAFWGYLKSFIPSELADGTQPEATITIVATNINILTCDEELPVMTCGTGSCVP